MSKERELLALVLSYVENKYLLVHEFEMATQIDETFIEIRGLLAQPEQTETVEICPDCGSKVTWYHCREGTRVVCADKCQGYKVIASRGRRDEYFTKGDL